MNFLSHYYFDKNETDSYKVLGAILPDLTKNTNKNWRLFPEKQDPQVYNSPELLSLLSGWKKHLAIDRIFHNTASFFYHQHEFKKKIAPIIEKTAIKPFFIGHIGYELCLDHLLLKSKAVDINRFYHHLKMVDYTILKQFLTINEINDTEAFIKYFSNFIKEAYLESYIKPSSISYAIKRICMRVWATPLSDSQKEQLTFMISNYISLLEEDFIIIFDEIEAQLINE